MLHILLLQYLALAIHHTCALQHARQLADDNTQDTMEKLAGVVEKQGEMIHGLQRIVSDQSENIVRLLVEESNQQTEIRALKHRLKLLTRKVSDVQWDSIHVSASAACSHLKPTMTKTVLPFVEEVSCATVCASSNTRYTTCLAMIRFNVMKTGRMEEAVPFGEVWVRPEACHSSSYSLGTELLKENPFGYYTVCCCGL
ncbi:hypothetical protein ACHWQZ_G002802 [Mnemiopsis leidyi]